MIRLLSEQLPVAAEPVGGIETTADGLPRLIARIRREPMTRSDWTTHDYNVHFCLGLENAADEAKQVELSIEGGIWDALPNLPPVIYQAETLKGPFATSSFPARTDLGKKYVLRVTVGANSRLYVANFLPRQLSELQKLFDGLAEAGRATRSVIGNSVDGHPLVSYVYGDTERRGTFLITSGFHPPEPDTFSTEAIMEFLATPEGGAVARDLAVVVVPVCNPDGFVRGTQAANASDINFYWHFACSDKTRCPEAAALWSLASVLKPRGYIDFHGYTFQRAKRAGPYQRPLFFYSSRDVRAAAAAMHQRMNADNLVPVHGFGSYAPHTLGSMLAARFDTITAAKFHVHLADGVEACRAQGLTAFRVMCEELIASKLNEPGSSVGWSWRVPVWRMRELWAGCVRPTIGLLRRGRVADLDFSRTGIVQP